MNTTVTLNNGLKMPTFGLGTFLSAPGEVGDAVQWAVEAGYIHIDTASLYGNEKEIGDALKTVFAEGKAKRDDIWVTTKIWPSDCAPGDVRPACEKSLELLQLDAVDLYLIHWPAVLTADKKVRTDVELMDTWREMEKLVDAGLVKSIGVSNFNVEQLAAITSQARIQPVVNQIEAHPFLQQKALVDACAKANVIITAYSPLGNPGRSGDRKNLLEDETVNAVAKKHGKSAAQILIKWSLATGRICIPKSVRKERIAENGNVFDFELDADDLAAIGKIEEEKGTFRFINPPFGKGNEPLFPERND